MPHLTIETLARLIDEPASASESAHLDLCDDCSRELEGLKADAAALAALPELEPPASQWDGIEMRLRNEGLLRNTATPLMPRRWLRPALQLAAALAIFVLGSYTGSFLFGGSAVQGPLARTGTSTPVNLSVIGANGSMQEAQRAVRDAETAYLTALTQYAQLAGGAQNEDPLARLAALESIVLTTREALGRAPADPVINGYHLTALAQRNATLKQLAGSGEKTWF